MISMALRVVADYLNAQQKVRIQTNLRQVYGGRELQIAGFFVFFIEEIV
jgi:hypothetical protein